MTTETKHNPCTFCGQEDDGLNLECISHPLGYKMVAIRCHVCGTMGPIAYKKTSWDANWSISEEANVAAWMAWDTRAVKNGTETRT